MSRVAKNPVPVPQGVEVSIDATEIRVKGPLGMLSMPLCDEVDIKFEQGVLTFSAKNPLPFSRAMSGTLRALLYNMIHGVTRGFEKKLSLVGVGYRAQAQGETLNLALGFSHPIIYKMPAGINVETPTQTEILIKGIDKQLVGQVAAEVRAYRPPELYKGKGVRYDKEQVTLKETKKK